MKKLTFGTPEACTPTKYCKDLRLEETDGETNISIYEKFADQ